MFRLGLRLAVQGGRETLVRLLVTALAVMVGTALLFSVLATFHGYQAAGSKPCLKVSDGDCEPAVAADSNNEAVAALYRRDAYKGKTITRLDLAKLSGYNLSIPGVKQMPQAGEYYTSPAMAALLKQAPAEELSDRYPGKQIGTIGEAGLHSPDELIIIVGREVADMPMSEAIRVTAIGAQETTDSNAAFMRFIAMLGAVALLFPMLILVGSASRLGAARREERYAAFRLVGATPKQVNIIASADAALGSALGVVFGIGLFFVLQPFLADLAITGSRAFASDVQPALWQFLLIAVGIPVSAVAASFLSLRRVRISPLGVSRKTTPPTPRAIGLLPLLLGIGLFTVAVLVSPSNDPPFAAVPGLMLIMIGLVTGGPWLTTQTVRLIAKLAHGASALLAVRRLSDNPKAAFRSVSGLVLVVFTASVIAFMAPAILSQRFSAGNDALNNVLTVEFSPAKPLQSTEGKQLIQKLQSMSGVEAFPVYNDPLPAEEKPKPGPLQPGETVMAGPPPAAISCDSLERLKALGACPAGAQAITISSDTFEDVIINHFPGSMITKESKPQIIDDSMTFRGMFVRASDATSLEKARTILSQQVVMPFNEVLLTFGETKKAAQATEAKLQAIISAGVIVSLITAGASVAVAVAGGLIERRRPFTLLRLSGAPLGTLYKVVLWEAAIPLIIATLAAAAIGFGTAALVITQFAPDSANARIEVPDLPYILALISGPVVALLIVCATLPLVGRLTKSDNIRFE
jgi:hypothetical protein